jgi:hypothetical protein
MAHVLNLRYSSSAGPVRVFVNGFLLINDPTGENSGSRLEPYVRPGKNLLRLEAQAVPKASVTVQVVVAPDSGGPEESELARLQLPNPNAPAGVAQTVFELPATLPLWGWTQLQPIPPGAEPAAHKFLATLAQLLQRGPDGELLRMLNFKHTEIGAATTIGKAAMDRGLAEGLTARRNQPGFKIDLVSPSELALVSSPERCLVRALRKDGHDAIMMFSDGMWMGFEVTLGFNQQWGVIR